MTEHEHRHDLPASGCDKSAVLGLVAGLRTTARTMTQKTQTQRYPEVKPDLDDAAPEPVEVAAAAEPPRVRRRRPSA